MTLEQILEEAKQLSREERRVLARALEEVAGEKGQVEGEVVAARQRALKKLREIAKSAKHQADWPGVVAAVREDRDA